jgi:Rho family protein
MFVPHFHMPITSANPNLLQVPTVFENYVTDCRVDGKSVQLALWDTAGQEDYERLRPLAYSKAHVILVGFSIDTPDSLDNVKQKVSFLCSIAAPNADFLQWVEEANEKSPGVPIILVGLKKDLREDPVAIEEMRKKSQHFVSTREATEIGHEIGARKYLECSSLTGEGVDDVFEAATRAAQHFGREGTIRTIQLLIERTRLLFNLNGLLPAHQKFQSPSIYCAIFGSGLEEGKGRGRKRRQIETLTTVYEPRSKTLHSF